MADVANAHEVEVEAAGGAAAEGLGGRLRRKKLILPLGAAALLAAAAAGTGHFLGWFAPDGSQTAVQTVPSFYFDLPEMVVNLSALDERTQYLKLQVTLETHDQASLAALQPAMPKVLDTFQVYLRELRVSDIEGSAGLQRLKEELLRRVNLAIHPAEVNAVLFREIIVQ